MLHADCDIAEVERAYGRDAGVAAFWQELKRGSDKQRESVDARNAARERGDAVPDSWISWQEASPLAVSFRALCGDLRGVNGGLKATPPPLVPPRPTGSTRAKHL
eukprot:COSAG05_NODE_446_length_9772_cov_117.012923_8_plen_105_part_00